MTEIDAKIENQYRLIGYEAPLNQGFVLPCYGRAAGANTYYRAICGVPGDRQSQIIDFEPYAPDSITPLPDDLHRQVSVGDLWCDVVLVRNEIIVGDQDEIWAKLAPRESELAENSSLMLLDACPEAEHEARVRLARLARQSVEARFGMQRAVDWRDQIYLRSGVLRLLRRLVDPKIRSADVAFTVESEVHIRIDVRDQTCPPQIGESLEREIGSLVEPFFERTPQMEINFAAAASDASELERPEGEGPRWRQGLVERTLEQLSAGIKRLAVIVPTVAGPTSILDEVCCRLDQMGRFENLIMVGGKSGTSKRVMERLTTPGKFSSMSVSVAYIQDVEINTERARPLYGAQQDPAKTLIIYVDADLSMGRALTLLHASRDATQMALLPPNLHFTINGRSVHEPRSITEFRTVLVPQATVVFDYEMAINAKLITGTSVVDRTPVLRDASKLIVAAKARDKRDVLACFQDLAEQLRLHGQTKANCLVFADIDARDFTQILPAIRSVFESDKIFHRPEGAFARASAWEEEATIVVKPDQFDYEYMKWAKNIAVMNQVVDIGLRIHWFAGKPRERHDRSPRRIFDYTGAIARTHPVSARLPSVEEFAEAIRDKYYRKPQEMRSRSSEDAPHYRPFER